MSVDGTSTPLAGVRVLDFTRILSGPYCTLLLAEMGADVIKVERSDRGDDTRSWGPPFLDADRGISTYFAALNRGKRSFALNFRAPGAKELLFQLAARSDIVIENFRPGVAESLGLDRASLSRENPAIIVCSISGYGRSGPYASYPGTEIVVEGMSGLMEITGPPDGDPVRFGIAMVDIATGLTASTRILASLLNARATGEGAQLECSLYATAVGALSTLITSYSATKEEPRRWGSHHPSLAPYGSFPSSDGYLITGVINDAMWPSFCEALELDGLAGRPEYRTNMGRVEGRDALHVELARQTRTRSTDYWLVRLRERGLLAAPVRKVGDAVTDPATVDMGLLVELEGFAGVVAPRVDGAAPGGGAGGRVPRLGEHTGDILGELLGMGPEDVRGLVAADLVRAEHVAEVDPA